MIRIPQAPGLPAFLTPRPVQPAASTATPRTPLFSTLSTGQRLGSAPAPLASPSIGAVMTPTTVALAAVAGVRAAIAAGKTKGPR